MNIPASDREPLAVTAIITDSDVASLIKQGSEEFFAAPGWLQVPPNNVVRTLAIRYQFACREFVLTTTEPNAVSPAILKTHAQQMLNREHWNGPVIGENGFPAHSTTPVSNRDVTVISGFYGMGNDFSDVTEKVRDLLATGTRSVVISDALFGTPLGLNGHPILLVTYLYRGKRGAVHVHRDVVLTTSLLADTAEKGVQPGQYSSDPIFGQEAPPWRLLMETIR